MIIGDKLRTRNIHASLYARDNLPIPLDRRDLRMLERAYIIEARKTAAQSHYYKRERKPRQVKRSRRTRDMNYMWDDLVSACTTTPATPAHSAQQRERCPGRVCRRASRDTYDAEVCHGGEILYFVQRQQKKGKDRNTGGREG
jgi:hypothetical protein